MQYPRLEYFEDDKKTLKGTIDLTACTEVRMSTHEKANKTEIEVLCGKRDYRFRVEEPSGVLLDPPILWCCCGQEAFFCGGLAALTGRFSLALWQRS